METRSCHRCEVEQDIEQFPIYRNGKTTGRRYTCRSCERERRQRQEERRGRVPRQNGSRQRDLVKRIKRCSACKEWKPFAEFSPRSGERSSGLRSRCRECERIKAAEYNQNNRDAINQRRRERRLRGKDETPENYHRWRINSWAKKMNTDPERLREYVNQQVRCEICGFIPDADTSWRNGLHIDHCHSTMKFRGILCASCNLALGKFKDSAENLERAIEYIKRGSPID